MWERTAGPGCRCPDPLQGESQQRTQRGRAPGTVLTMAAIELSQIPTCDLVNELAKREGVLHLWVSSPESTYSVIIDRKGTVKSPCGVGSTGPARILVVTD